MKKTNQKFNVINDWHNQKIAIVRWRDSSGRLCQHSFDEELSIEIIESCGYVLKDNQNGITLYQDGMTKCNPDNIRCSIIIPAENILYKKIIDLSKI